MRVGIDLVEIKRLEGKDEHFLERVFTAGERAYANGRMETLAGMFAAKEAAAKAFGTGVREFGLTDIEVTHAASGAPMLVFHNAAEKLVGNASASVSISHDGGMAGAIVALFSTNRDTALR